MSAVEPPDCGGWLKPGFTTVRNTSGKREPVLTEAQWRKLQGER